MCLYINICKACSVQSVNLKSSSNKKSFPSENIHAIHVRTQCSHGENELLEVFLGGKNVLFSHLQKRENC